MSCHPVLLLVSIAASTMIATIHHNAMLLANNKMTTIATTHDHWNLVIMTISISNHFPPTCWTIQQDFMIRPGTWGIMFPINAVLVRSPPLLSGCLIVGLSILLL
jgi:hypothetical protein